MKDRVHEQLGIELKQASRTDVTVAIIAIVVTFIFFGMASGFAASTVGYDYSLMGGPNAAKFDPYSTAVMFISIAAIILINFFAIRSLVINKRRKAGIAENLVKLSQEEGAVQYYDADVFKAHGARGNVLMAILATIATAAVFVPIVIFIRQIIEEL
jgi:hypothetical protein